MWRTKPGRENSGDGMFVATSQQVVVETSGCCCAIGDAATCNTAVYLVFHSLLHHVVLSHGATPRLVLVPVVFCPPFRLVLFPTGITCRKEDVARTERAGIIINSSRQRARIYVIHSRTWFRVPNDTPTLRSRSCHVVKASSAFEQAHQAEGVFPRRETRLCPTT